MATIDGYDIKPEKADEKGMLNANAIAKFSIKATKTVCKINIPGGGFGSGFFCKIPYTENNNVLMPVLITNNHVLSSDSLNFEWIEIILEGESKIIPLKQRKKWTNKDMDFTFIEIKEEDNIHSFYNLDEDVLDEDFSNEGYINQNVIIFAINKNDKQVGLSNGLIKKNIDCFFEYNCNTFPGCSGGCIVNQFSNGVIGIHIGEIKKGDKNDVSNLGIYIRDVIKYIKNSNPISLPIVNH